MTIVASTEVLEAGQRTLRELADEANREHEATESSMLDVLSHAIAAGKALLEAKNRTLHGEWQAWLEQNFAGSRETASRYMRLAYYEDVVLPRPWASGGVGRSSRWTADTTAELTRAWQYLRGLPPAGDGRRPQHSEEIKSEARRLHAAGVSYREIARMLGVSHHSVPRWCDADYRRRRQAEANRQKARQRDEAARRKQQARDRAVARTKGPGSEAYSLLRRAAQMLERAAVEAEDREVRAAFTAAQAQIYKAEDRIMRGLGVA